ncbi:MAG TPA: hypothetical protein VMB23_10690, partial [Spirochaetia bacterium]|nr:hypothetical protein [Spirochaetia bacterium]
MRLLRWFLPTLGAVSLGAALWFTPTLWAHLDGWVQDQRDRVWSQLEQVVGEKIVYRRIAPSVLAALDFQDVRVLADDGSVVFSAASIRITWDWGLLFQGKFTEAFRKIQVINASVNLDSRRDAKLLQRWTTGASPSAGPSAFGFTLEAFNLSARWTDGVRSVALDRGFGLLAPEGDHWGLRFRGSLAATDKSSASWAQASVRGEVRSDPLLENLSVRVALSRVSTTWFDLEPVTVQLNVGPRSVTVAKVADQVPLDLQASWDPSSGGWRFQGASENFRPSRWIHWKNTPLVSGLVEGTVTGTAEYRLGGDFGFSGRVSWPAGALP